ncbi:MAG: RimK-like ATPgrasp N-terminal domain-containing protein [Candidatus Bathyarchaeota archaeon]|nr:RimK-like ATPgrasp N-terminal domain-containing protein [Candidatus Bathyarchaeota archaeon]
MVVSNIDLTTEKIEVIKPSKFLGTAIKDFTLNLSDDYRYLKTGYYVSLHAEVLGSKVIPSCENIIDSSRTPILLLRAAKAGIPTLPFLVTDSVKKIIAEIGFPVAIFAVNPFIHNGYKTAANKSALYRAMKSLGMNYKFAVCAQPLKGEMVSVKSIFGKSEGDRVTKEISEQVFEVFKIPVCKLHIQKVEDKTYLCGMQPLGRKEISLNDLKTISRGIALISERGEPFSD